jgi:hypothetical protein
VLKTKTGFEVWMRKIVRVDLAVPTRYNGCIRSYACSISKQASPKKISRPSRANHLLLRMHQKAKVCHPGPWLYNSSPNLPLLKCAHNHLGSEVIGVARDYCYFVARIQMRKQLVRHLLRSKLFISRLLS